MSTTEVLITIDQTLLDRVDRLVETHIFPSRDEAVQTAIREKVDRLQSKTRLAEECAKLDPLEEQAMAEEGFAEESNLWPKY